MEQALTMAPGDACARYEALRAWLPSARFPLRAASAPTLAALADEIDVFVLDGFGVLNVGERPVPGAPARVRDLRAAGKRVLVLTNSATYATDAIVAKYAALGFDFASEDVISSRDALAEALAARRDAPSWGFAATSGSAIGAIAPGAVLLGDDPAPYASVEGFALLSSNEWTPARQALLIDALRANPRPVLVGNPDLVAPRDDALSIEPGFYAHAIREATGVAPEFFGKPYANVFALAQRRIGPGVPPERIAMVGDTLHTDILGGAAQGWRTALVRAHGLLKNLDAAAWIARSGIVPDFIVETT